MDKASPRHTEDSFEIGTDTFPLMHVSLSRIKLLPSDLNAQKRKNEHQKDPPTRAPP